MKIRTSFDIETTGLNAHRGAEIFSYCIGWPDGHVDVRRLDGKDGQDPKANWKLLQGYLENLTYSISKQDFFTGKESRNPYLL